jgi:hypothetical protein
MKFYYVHALDKEDCETATDSQLTLKEALARAREFLSDKEIFSAGAIRVKVYDEQTDECVRDWIIG